MVKSSGSEVKDIENVNSFLVIFLICLNLWGCIVVGVWVLCFCFVVKSFWILGMISLVEFRLFCFVLFCFVGIWLMCVNCIWECLGVFFDSGFEMVCCEVWWLCGLVWSEWWFCDCLVLLICCCVMMMKFDFVFCCFFFDWVVCFDCEFFVVNYVFF